MRSDSRLQRELRTINCFPTSLQFVPVKDGFHLFSALAVADHVAANS